MLKTLIHRTAKLNWDISISRELDLVIIGFQMTKWAIHCGKPTDMNVLSNSCPVSLMDKTVIFKSQGGGFDSQKKLGKFFTVFLCDMKT